MRKLFRFHGGVHPLGHKTESTGAPIAAVPLPQQLVIPFRQHAGAAAKPLVQAGEAVLKGQLIGESTAFVSSSIHAPTSGTIRAVELRPVPHASGLSDLCAVLEPDGKEEWIECRPVDYRNASIIEVRRQLRNLGVVGLGGAVFPSDVKLSITKIKVRTLILNGAECEPWITCDDMLMREHADEVVAGAEILRFLYDADEVLIGVEDNKPEAISALRQAVATSGHSFEVVAVPTLYPGGSAKHLIRVLTGIEVPSGKLPTDVGVQCFNVATASKVHRALDLGEPLISRIVTLTGHLQQPRNYEALIGTSLAELLALSGPLPDTRGHIMGGPMMGTPLAATDVPLVKATNCVIATSDALFPPPPPVLPCIRCTRCAQACPVELQPMDLYWFARSKNFAKARSFDLFDCIECGACAYVCPSHIPLVDYYRFAKSELRQTEQEQQAADRARSRHEYREFRIERDKQEKAERLAAKERAAMEAKKPAPAAPPPQDDPENTVQRKIQAAIDHAREQAAANKPANTDNLTPEQQAEIAAIEAQRARIRDMAKSEVEHPEE